MDYKDTFQKIEASLIAFSGGQIDVFEKNFKQFKHFEKRSWSDAEVFRKLTLIVFYSGFKAATVEKKIATIFKHFPDLDSVSKIEEESAITSIMNDPDMISNELKIRAVIKNAKTLKELIRRHKSFQGYLDTFNANESFEHLVLLKESIESKFAFLGGITAFHLLTDLGYNVLKPDRVIARIFNRLGLIENENLLWSTVIQGQKFAEATNLPIRYIDIILVQYGQIGIRDHFGLKGGICTSKKPQCELCNVRDICNYEDEKSA